MNPRKKFVFLSRAVFSIFVFFVFLSGVSFDAQNVFAQDKKCEFIKGEIRFGSKNNDPVEIAKLQYFLKQYEGFSNLPVNGSFDIQTVNAVKTFQIKYSADILKPWGYEKPTGVVYFLTQKKINEIVCGTNIALTQAQIKEIQDFKSSKDVVKDVVEKSEPIVESAPIPTDTTPKTEDVSVKKDSDILIELGEDVLKENSVSTNKKIFGGWFSSFGTEATTTQSSIFSIPHGINAVEAVVLFIVTVLFLNVLSTVVSLKRSAIFVVGTLIATALSIVFNRSYMVIPFVLVLGVSLYIFLKHTFIKDEETFSEPKEDLKREHGEMAKETVVELVPEIQHGPENVVVPMEEPEPIIEPAVDIELDPAVLEKVPELSTQKEVKIIMGHVVKENPPVEEKKD